MIVHVKFLFSQLNYLLGQRQARSNLKGLFQYFGVLAAVIVVFAVLFHVIMEYEGRSYSWVTGVYWTLTVMSTLGFGDITFESDLGRTFSIIVLLVGIVLLLIVLPFAFIRFFYAPWLEAQVRARAPRSLPEETRGHVIICRWDEVARGLAERLRMLEVPYFVLEPDPTEAANLFLEEIPVMAGERDAAATFQAARVDAARAVFVNMDDPTNTNITLTIRERSTSVPIFATAEHRESIDLIELAGATQVVPLKQRLGEQLANRVNARHTEAHVVGRFKDLLIAEFAVHKTPLVGSSIREAGLRQSLGVNVVGVWQRGRLLPATPDTLLTDSSVPVVVGTEPQIQELDRAFERFDVNENPVLIIGGGRVGRAAGRALRTKGVGVHLIERDPVVANACESVADRVFVGEAADRVLLEQAGLTHAPSVLLTTNEDAINIYLCIYCRRLNPELRIVTRITHERNVEAMHRAGADFVLSHASLGRESVLALVQKRELVFVGEGVGFYTFATPESLVGQTLLESEIGKKSGLNVIAIEQRGALVSNPPPETRLARDSRLCVIGTSEQRKEFNALFGGTRV